MSIRITATISSPVMGLKARTDGIIRIKYAFSLGHQSWVGTFSHVMGVHVMLIKTSLSHFCFYTWFNQFHQAVAILKTN